MSDTSDWSWPRTTFKTLTVVGADTNNTIVIPRPIEIPSPISDHLQSPLFYARALPRR